MLQELERTRHNSSYYMTLFLPRKGKSIQSENTLVFPGKWDRDEEGAGTVAGTACEWVWKLFLGRMMEY